MANRTFNQFQGTLEKGVVTLFAEISFDGAGVSTLVRGKGIASLQDNGTGDLSIFLQDTYQRVLGFSVGWKGSVSSAGFSVIVADDGSAISPAPYIDVLLFDSTSVLTNPDNGQTAFITITLSNSTAL